MTSWNILIEPSPDGQTTATVLELPSFQVKASDRETALQDIQQLLAQRLASAEVVSISIPTPGNENPWLKYGGMFRDDADFEAITQELQQERQAPSSMMKLSMIEVSETEESQQNWKESS